MGDTTIRTSLKVYNDKEREKSKKRFRIVFHKYLGEVHLCYRNKFLILFK